MFLPFMFLPISSFISLGIPSNHNAESRGEPCTAPVIELAWIVHSDVLKHERQCVTTAMQCVVNWVMDADVELHGCVTMEDGAAEALGMELQPAFRTRDGDSKALCVLTRERWSQVKKQYSYAAVLDL